MLASFEVAISPGKSSHGWPHMAVYATKLCSSADTVKQLVYLVKLYYPKTTQFALVHCGKFV